MKHFILTLTAVALIYSSNFGQNSFLADSLRNSGELKLAIEEYARLYKQDSTNRDNVYNYSCALALNKQIDEAFYFLNVATEKDSSVEALNDSDFYFLIEDDRWAILQNKLIQRVEAKYGKYGNVDLAKELWTMRIKDQAFYYQLGIVEKSVVNRSVLEYAIWELKKKLNKENLDRLAEIIEVEGWPKKSVVGGNAAITAFLIIQHSDLKTQKKYLPVMKKAADSNEANWSSLALLIDRVRLGEGKKQIYGSQIYRNEDGSFYVKDLENPEYVNQRRKEVGLGPIEDYVSRWGIKWSIEQK